MYDIFLILFLLAIIGSIYWYWSRPKNLPPGPIGLPVIGSTLHYLDGSKQHLLLMDDVKKYGPIFSVYICNKLVIVLGDYDTIQEALVKQGDVFAGRPQFLAFVPEEIQQHGVIASEGDLWKTHRRFALSTLRDFGVGRPILESRIKEEIEHLCERLNGYADSREPFDPQRWLTCAVANIISQLLFGRRFSYDDEEFNHQFMLLSKRLSSNEIAFLSPFVLSETVISLLQWLPLVRQIKQEVADFVEYVRKQVKQATATFDADQDATNYVHAYLKHAVTEKGSQENFTDAQLLATCDDLFIAGAETSSTTIRWAILFLAHSPDVQEKLYKEIKNKIGTNALPSYADRIRLPYADAVVMETQRLANLVPTGISRRTLDPTKLMGYDIPENTIILPFLHNVLHNPDFYPEPTKFKPERFLDENGKVIRDPKLIPFQAGKRMCLGEPLARMELFLMLVGLVSRFRFYFPNGTNPTMNPIVGLTSIPRPYQVCVESRMN